MARCGPPVINHVTNELYNVVLKLRSQGNRAEMVLSPSARMPPERGRRRVSASSRAASRYSEADEGALTLRIVP